MEPLFVFTILTVFNVIHSGVPLSDFYPFGYSHGDRRVPTNDDGSSPKINISTRFPFFNQQFSSLFVNTNGAISFKMTLSTFTPSPFPLSGNRKMVAPYWCDIDTRNGGDVWFYETTQPDLLARASKEAREVFPGRMNFKAKWIFVATWDNVAFFGASTTGKLKRNTFQCILITNGQYSFTIFLYNKIQWTTGTASGGNDYTGLGGTPAQVGFDAGDGVNYKAIPESRTSAVINVASLGQTGTPGRFVYRIDQETVIDGGCSSDDEGILTIFPKYGTMFGGTEVFVGGPCLYSGDNLSLQFRREAVSAEVRCKMHSKYAAKCVTPSVYATGDFRITLVITTNTGGISRFSGVYTFLNPATINSTIQRIDPLSWQNGKTVMIRWDELPFTADKLIIEQFHINRRNNLPVLEWERFIAQDFNAARRLHQFNFRSSGPAAILRIRPTTNDPTTPGVTMEVPSIWSDLFIAKPSDKTKIQPECKKWDNIDSRYTSIDKQEIETCPCSIAQARLDVVRFHPDPQCNSISESTTSEDESMVNCLYEPGVDQCIRMAVLRNSGHDNKCCYDANGNLKETDGTKFGSSAQRYHYKGGIQNVPYLSNIMDDVIPYMYCCQYPSEFQLEDNGQCKEFITRRPASRCEGYVPPRPAFIYGILHFVTLDGLKYTFNGVGEFTALESKDQSLRIQVRAEQLKDQDGKLKNGSVATAVALQCGSRSDIVEVRLNSIRVSDVLVNHKQVDFEDRTTVDIKGSTIIRDRSKGNNSDETVWTLVSCSDPEIAVNVTAITNLMNINIIVADEKLRDNLRGLLGNYNGRADDDFTTPTGRKISIDSSLEVIHAQFGMTWQIKAASNSLFTYAVGTSYDTFKNPNVDYKPTTKLSDRCKRKAAALCGGDETCQFDFCISDDLDIITFSRQMSNERKELEKVALPPCGQPKDVLDGDWELGGQSAYLVCDDNYAANNVTEITCLPDGQWEDFITTCEAIPIVAEPIVADPGVPIGVVGGLVAGIVLLILGMILFIIFLKRTGRLQPAKERVTAGLRTIRNTVRRFPASDKTHLRHEEDTCYYDGVILKGDNNMAILQGDIALESVLAQGKFATIYLAKYYGHRQIPNIVAAKALKENHNEDDIAKMISKINFYSMKVGHHKNILDFFGSVEDDTLGPMMILEYCSNGPLKDYLSSMRSRFTIDVQERLYRITFAICNGMAYLASKKIVHRKLAARNILLDQYLEPKIIGFGPEPQQTDENETTTEKLPIKWMAPECTKTTQNANELSDVWSYGIVMWEIFSLGDTPYPGMDSRDVPNQLKKGHKMAKPEYCDDAFYQVMKGCWRYYAKDRQRFAQIKKQLNAMFTEGPDDECYYKMN